MWTIYGVLSKFMPCGEKTTNIRFGDNDNDEGDAEKDGDSSSGEVVNANLIHAKTQFCHWRLEHFSHPFGGKSDKELLKFKAMDISKVDVIFHDIDIDIDIYFNYYWSCYL